MKIKNILLASLCTVSFIQADIQSHIAQAELTAELQATKGNQEVQIDGLMKKIGSIGYSTVAANTNIQNFYYQKYKEKNVEMISFFAMVNKAKLRPLLLANPDFGAYAPFNFLAYKTLDTVHDNNTWYGHLAPSTMLDIVGEKNSETRAEFTNMVESLDTLVNSELKPTQKRRFEHTKALPEHGLTKMVKTFETPDDLEEFVEDFISDHDGRFSTHNFIIAGFIDFKFEYDDMDMEFDKYDAYWVSLLCHFKFSNSIFNHGIPQAGMFAPCSVYFYIPKGKNELHVGYASVDNWINALNFKDQKRIDYMRKIDAEVVEVFREMGFKLQINAGTTVATVLSKEEQIAELKAQIVELKAQLAAKK